MAITSRQKLRLLSSAPQNAMASIIKRRKRNEKVLIADKSLVDPVRTDYKLLESKPFLKVTELSKILNVSRSTIYNLINNGIIPIIKVGNRTLISRKYIDHIFKSNQVIKTTQPKPVITSYYTSSETQNITQLMTLTQ